MTKNVKVHYDSNETILIIEKKMPFIRASGCKEPHLKKMNGLGFRGFPRGERRATSALRAISGSTVSLLSRKSRTDTSQLKIFLFSLSKAF
ncbi:hypothetical protein ACUXCC_004042 [Cytobacillus horneckiae]|uniref:hypothetical protein n=1 Tax=Cytobacillus horneckiae TaxID=549687 RepID=UPI0019D1F42B|nr:hypothetical protein [Cytobacillus horneckiae]MBN6887655.1 hypothetical protein [Cytobacillus horneckiae]MCM3178713.1 hypothetical protein [Cytobacillus horneckiae]